MRRHDAQADRALEGGRPRGWLVGAMLGAALALGCASQAGPAPAVRPQRPHATHAEPALTAPILVRDVGFEAPESIIHDVVDDVYLVSNIAGSPLSPDDRAFISRLHPDGTVESLKWIDAAKPSIELHAPKGLAIVGRTLYVADIDEVRSFDCESGHAIASIVVPGARFLNDISAAPDGTLYVTDSGLGRGLTPTGHDAIYRIAPDGAVAPLTRARELGQPSGLWADADGLWVVGFGSGELYRLDSTGARIRAERLPKGSLDGLAVWSGHIYVSSWEGSAVYERSGDGFVERIPKLDSPADLAIDEKRQRLLVTHYNQNAVSIHQL